jgi:hypothetical protein
MHRKRVLTGLFLVAAIVVGYRSCMRVDVYPMTSWCRIEETISRIPFPVHGSGGPRQVDLVLEVGRTSHRQLVEDASFAPFAGGRAVLMTDGGGSYLLRPDGGRVTLPYDACDRSPTLTPDRRRVVCDTCLDRECTARRSSTFRDDGTFVESSDSKAPDGCTYVGLAFQGARPVHGYSCKGACTFVDVGHFYGECWSQPSELARLGIVKGPRSAYFGR